MLKYLILFHNFINKFSRDEFRKKTKIISTSNKEDQILIGFLSSAGSKFIGRLVPMII